MSKMKNKLFLKLFIVSVLETLIDTISISKPFFILEIHENIKGTSKIWLKNFK